MGSCPLSSHLPASWLFPWWHEFYSPSSEDLGRELPPAPPLPPGKDRRSSIPDGGVSGPSTVLLSQQEHCCQAGCSKALPSASHMHIVYLSSVEGLPASSVRHRIGVLSGICGQLIKLNMLMAFRSSWISLVLRKGTLFPQT